MAPKPANVVIAFVLKPDALEDMTQLVLLGRLTINLYPGNVRVLGTAPYRAGQFQDALRCFEESSRITQAHP